MMKGDIIDKMMVMIGLGAINLPLIYWGLVFFQHRRATWATTPRLIITKTSVIEIFGLCFPKTETEKYGELWGGVTYCSVVDFEYLD